MVKSKYVIFKSLVQIFVITIYLANFNGARSECSSSSDWECDDGECIPDDQLCDGKAHCKDRSDEIAENCIQYHETCPKFAFRCAYGACVDGKARCNGVQDCADNSDELICVRKDDSDFQGICSDTEAQCSTTKECINSNQLCDGIAHCQDKYDESLEVCINYGCISYGFQCGNGGCISGNTRCNGVTECADGSDEAWALCNTPRKKNNLVGVVSKPTPDSQTPRTPTPITTRTPTSTVPPPQPGKCIIPNIPPLQNLRFKLHPKNQTIELGSYAEDYEIVHIECTNKYTLRGQSSLLCNKGEWNNNYPTCDGYCDGTLFNRLSLRAICDFRQNYIECPKRISPGTKIHVNCAFGYGRKQANAQVLQCMPNGSYDKDPESCEMTCGRIAPTSTVLSKFGFEIDSSLAPWHVAIYENNSAAYIYKCGGSIVSPTVVISAAHCFWDEANQLLRTYTGYQIIAGRSSSNYTTEQSLYSQLIKVQEIHIPQGYRGKDGRQRDDIAFVKLEIPLKFSETIAAICIPTELRSTATSYVLSNKPGFINGFGVENKLERLGMVTLAYHACVEKSPPDAPVADDKFCIYNTDGGLVCRGDSGGGFFIEQRDLETNEIIYRLWGVISNTPTTTNDCTRTGDQGYVAITNIFNAPSDFLMKLEYARKEDETLF